MSDENGNGIPDSMELESDMIGSDGNPIVQYDGQNLSEIRDGNHVDLVDADRNVVATVWEGGVVRNEGTGEYLQPMEGEIGWDVLHGTQGTNVTLYDDDSSGLDQYQTTDGVGLGQDSSVSDRNPLSDSDSPGRIDGSDSQDEAADQTNGRNHRQTRVDDRRPTNNRSYRQRQTRRRGGSILGKIILTPILMVVFGGSSFTFSMMAMTIIAQQTGAQTGAIAANLMIWLVLIAIVIGVTLGLKLYRTYISALAAILVVLGYGFGMVMYWIYLVTYLWK